MLEPHIGLVEELKGLRRSVALEASWANRCGAQALVDLAETYRKMLLELVNNAEYKALGKTLYYALYKRFREEYPWLSTRVVKRCINDATRISKWSW